MAERAEAREASGLKRQEPVVYRRAIDDAYLERIFRLRYESYQSEGTIEVNPDERFTDAQDEAPNAFIFGIEQEGDLLASIRMHVCSAEMPFAPGLEVFPDILEPMVSRGESFVDPTRFVVQRHSRRAMGNLPFATVRLAAMAAEHFHTDHILATVRVEHAPFYRRFFDMELLSEGRTYPGLARPICLMAGRWQDIKKSSYHRVPDFDSGPRERMRLFGPSREIALGMTAAPPFNDNADEQAGRPAGDVRAG